MDFRVLVVLVLVLVLVLVYHVSWPATACSLFLLVAVGAGFLCCLIVFWLHWLNFGGLFVSLDCADGREFVHGPSIRPLCHGRVSREELP